MSFSFDHLLVNTAWQALTTDHAELAVSSLFARRYPADVVPISALEGLRAEALAELREVLGGLTRDDEIEESLSAIPEWIARIAAFAP